MLFPLALWLLAATGLYVIMGIACLAISRRLTRTNLLSFVVGAHVFVTVTSYFMPTTVAIFDSKAGLARMVGLVLLQWLCLALIGGAAGVALKMRLLPNSPPPEGPGLSGGTD